MENSFAANYANLKTIRKYSNPMVEYKTKNALALYKTIDDSIKRAELLANSQEALEQFVVVGQTAGNTALLDCIQDRLILLRGWNRNEKLVKPGSKVALIDVLMQ